MSSCEWSTLRAFRADDEPRPSPPTSCHNGLTMISTMRSLRILGKHWKLTAIAVFSLSIALALGVVSLSVSNTALLLPPAGAEPDQLVTISSRAPDENVGQISYPDYKY